ncbi:MAG: hypothetical protein ACREPB_01310 [Arenimonas sp.]
MDLSSQLKRGYLALIGMALLGFTVLSTPEFTTYQKQISFPELTRKACNDNKKTGWRLASTPIDIQPILMRKAMLCRA